MKNKADIAQESDAEMANDGHSGSEASGLLKDPKEIAKDLSMIRGLVQRGRRWPKLSYTKRSDLYRRLLDVAKKKHVTVPCGEGTFDSESEADKNAMKAIQILGMLEGQVQKDEHKQLDVKNPSGGINLNVGVSVHDRYQEMVERDPDYVEWKRERELSRITGTVSVGGGRFQEQVLGAGASEATGEVSQEGSGGS